MKKINFAFWQSYLLHLKKLDDLGLNKGLLNHCSYKQQPQILHKSLVTTVIQ